MSAFENLGLLLTRPTEPLFVPKGPKKIIFDVPRESLEPGDHDISDRVNFGPGETVPVVRLASYPNFNEPLKLARDEPFTIFNPTHQKYAEIVIKIFMNVPAFDLINVAAYVRDRMNPQLYHFGLSTALAHRPDTKNIQLPPFAEVFPDKFFGSSVINKVRREATIAKQGSRIPIQIPRDFTATDVDPEHRLAYFREDIGINLHHYHWHLIFPFYGDRRVVNKNRRGELFYYMHRQIIARYNVERFCNGLGRTVPLEPEDYLKPLPEAYFPKMTQNLAGRNWPSRPANMVLSDVNRSADNINYKISDLVTWKTRLQQAIRTQRLVVGNGEEILDENTGIDILGNLIEASPVLSRNFSYYGTIHNAGHMILAYAHDPDARYLESFSIMGDSNTAMRDPIFYRWHTFIDNLFLQYKSSLRPYPRQDLLFPVGSSNLTVERISLSSPNSNPNTLKTYWTRSEINLSSGLDFVPQGDVLVSMQHLNHDNFEYTISVNNPGRASITGTVRIYIAPKVDNSGHTLTFEEQRVLMIEMDKFTSTIKPGKSEIKRQSGDSAVTIPYQSTFRNLRGRSTDPIEAQAFDFCGCGWPDHMLLPKGTTNGLSMDLFVMITDYEKDKTGEDTPGDCRTGVSFCGLRDRLYPDVRPMGFPFDRPTTATTFDQFLTSNMKVQPITIRHENVEKLRQTS